jgi:indolepyruvate ferredoxin oxidoreductase beta subunit
MDTPSRVTRVLVAALGGEGGGVLAGWLVACARGAGLPVQATSVPGVAQRTGSTSYYLEWQAAPAAAAAPVFALHPMAGRIDVLVASELLEAARMIERGFVGGGTTLIASTHRVYTTLEKMVPADGRYDGAAVLGAARALAGRCVAFDMDRLAREHGTVVSAVMFGALAGAGVLPWPRGACEAVIGDGAAAQASLRGFAAGFDAVAGSVAQPAAALPEVSPQDVPPQDVSLQDVPDASRADPWRRRVAALPGPMQATVLRGLLRALDFQDAAYAERFVREAEALSSAAGADAARIAVAEDAARSLALWLCFEDIIRVADLKSRRARLEQVRAEAAVQPGQVLRVTEMLVPGVDEVAAILPRRLGAALARTAQRRGWSGRLQAALPLRSTSAWGCALLRLLALLKPLRPHSLRQHEEDLAIAAWTEAMHRTLPRCTAYAAALARLPDVLKGYGDTHRRGRLQYAALWRDHVAPALDDPRSLDARAEPFRSALRAAAALPAAGMAGSAPPVTTPQPVRFFRSRPGAPPAP